MSRTGRLLSLFVCLLASRAVAADDLPPRAIARLGDHCFYPGHSICCAAINHDGSRVVTGLEIPHDNSHTRRTLCVWDADTGKEMRRWELPEGELSCLVFSPDGKQLVASCGGALDEPHYVYIYDPETGKLLRRLGSFKNAVKWLQYSTDGKRLHVGEDIRLSSGATAVTSWDTATGERRGRWDALTIPPRETDKDYTTWNILAARLSADEKIILWHIDIQTETPRGATDFAKHRYVVRGHDAAANKELYELDADYWTQFFFSADGQRFTIRSESPAAIRDAATGKVIRALQRPLTEYRVAALFPDSPRAVLWAKDYELRVYELETGQMFDTAGTIKYPDQFDVSLSGDGKTLFVTTQKNVRLWNWATGQERLQRPGHRKPPWSLWFSPDGKTLVSQCEEAICEWNVAQAAAVSRQRQLQPTSQLLLTRSPDGRYLLVQDKKTLELQDAKTGRTVRRFEEYNNKEIANIWFSPGGERAVLLFKQDEPCLEWFDVLTGKRLGKAATTGHIWSLVFSADDRLLAWSTDKQTISVADAVSGRLLPTPSEAGSPSGTLSRVYHALALSADGTYLAAVSYTGLSKKEEDPAPIRVFHVGSGKEIVNFFIHPEEKETRAFRGFMDLSPDGRLLAVVKFGGRAVEVVEIASGRTRLVLSGHRDQPTTLAFSPDGQTLASGGDDNVIYLWDVSGARTKGPERGTPEELETWWRELAGAHAVRAGEASAALIRNPERSVPFLKERLRPIPVVDEKRLARLVADLDAGAFEQREAASRELARLGELVEQGLRQALANKPSREAKRRIEELLETLDGHQLPPETLRDVRAVEALEHIGTPAARDLLKELAQGAAEVRQTRDAKASLRRLEKGNP
jgi:WD40 repeat protein